MWPDRYAAYTAMPAPGGPDPHAREREVLDLAAVIRIRPQFSAAEQDRARVAAARDPRLATAVKTAGYGLTQTLAAAPQLVARWEDAQERRPVRVGGADRGAGRGPARRPRPAHRRPAAGRRAGLLHQRPAGRSAGQLVRAGPGLRHRRNCTAPPPPWPLPGPAWARSPGTPSRITCSSMPSGNVTLLAFPPAPGTPCSATSATPADAARVADSAEGRLLYRYAIPLYHRAGDDVGPKPPTGAPRCSQAAATWTGCALSPTPAISMPPAVWLDSS